MHKLSPRFPADYNDRALCQREAGGKKNRFKILRILHRVLGVLNMLHTYYIIISTQTVQSWLLWISIILSLSHMRLQSPRGSGGRCYLDIQFCWRMISLGSVINERQKAVTSFLSSPQAPVAPLRVLPLPVSQRDASGLSVRAKAHLSPQHLHQGPPGWGGGNTVHRALPQLWEHLQGEWLMM